MLIAASIKKLLDNNKYFYRALSHKRVSKLEKAASLLNIDLKQILNVQILVDKYGPVMVVHPLDRQFDLLLCKEYLRRDLIVLPNFKVNRIFTDCEAGSWPAIGHPYNLEVVIDKNIQQLDTVYFSSGCQNALLKMSATSYLKLNAPSKVFNLTREIAPNEFMPAISDASNHFEMLPLPMLPPIAMQILQWSLRQEASTNELVELITQDSGIQKQIMYHMQLPFIKEQDQVADDADLNAMQHAVEHVLGFSMVSHIALGVAAGRVFGKQRSVNHNAEFWRHAFYAATYAQQITKLVADQLELDPAISYLAGLFHNFGLLLFSELFPPEYSLLNKWMRQNPKICISILEKRLLGMGRAFNAARGGHAQLGEVLLRSWKIPEAICVITKEHHNTKYNGDYAPYVKIIQLTNQLLREEGIGDGTTTGLNPELLSALGLDIEQIYASVKQIKECTISLENMATSLTTSL